MKIIIAGSRVATLRPIEILDYLQKFNWFHDDIEVVSGGARGMDTAGEIFAQTYNLKLHKFPADWDNYGKVAGILRNKEMGEFADALFAVWDGKSRGTKHMIDFMRSLDKPVQIVYFVTYTAET